MPSPPYLGLPKAYTKLTLAAGPPSNAYAPTLGSEPTLAPPYRRPTLGLPYA